MIPVMLSINCSEISWKQTDMWGSIPSLTRPLPSWFIPARLYVFKLPERPVWSIHFWVLMEILFGPKTLPVARCHSVLQCLCSVCPAEMASLESDWQRGWLSKGCRLTPSRFLLNLTNVYDNTNELSSVQKCAFQIPQRFFCMLIIFNLISHVLFNLVTVRCTYWGPLWWRD